MKIAYCSDLHLEFGGHIPDLIVCADVLVLAGDILESRHIEQFTELFEQLCAHYKAVIYVAGNHEHYRNEIAKSYQMLKEFAAKFDNLHFLQNETVTVDGVVFAGCTLWSHIPNNRMYDAQLAMSDYHLIKIKTDSGYRKFKPKDSVLEHAKSVSWLSSVVADVVITHHAPSTGSIHPRYENNKLNCCYVTNLEHLMFDKKLWFHGHMHDPFDYFRNSCNVLCNPRGYAHEHSHVNFNVKALWKLE